MLEIFFICLAFGCFSGILAGLFGLGGGVVLVPFFLVLLESHGIANDLLMIIAVATSLATIIVTSIAASMAHHRLGSVIWKHVCDLSYGMVAGVMVGTWVADASSTENLRLIFALYLFYVAVKMTMPGELKAEFSSLNALQLKIAGVVIGFVSSVLGIGGGTLTVPLLARHQVPMRNAVAISSACGFPIAVIGTLSYAFLGWQQAGLPEGSIGYVYLPAFAGIVISSMLAAPMGAKLANKLPTVRLKQYFSLLLFAVAGKLLWMNFI